MTSSIMSLTTNIVTTHMSNTQIGSDEIVGLIESVFHSLNRLEDEYRRNHHKDGTPIDVGTPALKASAPQEAPVESVPAPIAAAPIATAPSALRRKDDVAAAPQPQAEAAPAATAEPATPPRRLVTRRSAASPQITTRDIADPTGQVDAARWPGVYPDKIICLEDKAEVTLLRAYVSNRFGLTFDQYREKWNLPDDYPNAPPAYSEHKRKQAKAVGLGNSVRSKKLKAEPVEVTPAPRKRGRKPGTLHPNYDREG